MRDTRGGVAADEIVHAVCVEIADGTLKLGAQLSGIQELAADISATAHTIHHALRLLAQEGFIQLAEDGPVFIVNRTPQRFTQRVVAALRSRKPLSIPDAAALELLFQEMKRGPQTAGERVKP